MRNYTRDISTRMVLAGTLIGASFFSAYFISASANRSEFYWSARTNLIPGSIVSKNEVEAVPVALNKFGRRYVLAGSPVVGFVVERSIKAGELLPIASLNSNGERINFVSLPISVQTSDVPKDLVEGEIVSVYQVGDPNDATSIVLPTLILSKVFVLGIDKSGANMGGSQTLTLSTRASNVLPALKGTSAGRLVVIRVNG